MKSKMMLCALLSACALTLGAASGCSDDEDEHGHNDEHGDGDPKNPSCKSIMDDGCHEADDGTNPAAHECHELAHADNEANCAAQKAQCIATCQGALDAGGD